MLLTVWALGFAALLAQAEQAPPEPPGPPSPAADPGVPAAPPPTESAAPAPAAPAPSPAELAPPGPSSTPASPASAVPEAEPPLPPPNCVSLLAGASHRLGKAGTEIPPAWGFALGGSYERRYGRLAPAIDAGVAFDFLYGRFSQAVGPITDELIADPSRTVSTTTFALSQTLGARAGRLRGWLAAGGGVAIDFFSSPEPMFRTMDKDNNMMNGSSSAVLPFLRGTIGADVEIQKGIGVGVRATYSAMLKSSSFTTDMKKSFQPFGDLLDIHAGLFYRF